MHGHQLPVMKTRITAIHWGHIEDIERRYCALLNIRKPKGYLTDCPFQNPKKTFKKKKKILNLINLFIWTYFTWTHVIKVILWVQISIFYRYLWPASSIVIMMVIRIVCVMLSVASFYNHKRCLERSRVSTCWEPCKSEFFVQPHTVKITQVNDSFCLLKPMS